MPKLTAFALLRSSELTLSGGIPKTFDAVYAGQVYAEHYNDFGNFLTQNDYAATIWFTLYESEAGLQSRQLVKG